MAVSRSRRRLLGAFAALGIVASVLAPPGSAVAADPAAFVQGFADGVLATLRDGALAPEERVRRVDAQVSQGFALDRIARVALGRYWKAASEGERAEFVALFTRSVLATYSRRFDAYADRRLRVAGAAPSGEQALVESYLEGGSAPVRLDWRLVETEAGWRVLDVVVEGVSLVVTYRNEFAAVIEQRGGRVSALIEELRQRARAEPATAAG